MPARLILTRIFVDGAVLTAIAAVFYHFCILGAERACASRYGEPYRQFLKRVPRYLLPV